MSNLDRAIGDLVTLTSTELAILREQIDKEVQYRIMNLVVENNQPLVPLPKTERTHQAIARAWSETPHATNRDVDSALRGSHTTNRGSY